MGNLYLIQASSKNPLGPFKSKLKKYYPSDRKLIDLFIFNDSNTLYLFHVRRLIEGNEIYVIELNDDLSCGSKNHSLNHSKREYTKNSIP